MNVCVAGLWHLGTVIAACLASGGHDVVGLDDDAAVVARLAEGTPPIVEPGLADLVSAGLASRRLRFTTGAAEAVEHADVVWVAYDTPVGEDDRADTDYVVDRTTTLLPLLRDGTLLLMSSQMPVGTTRRLEEVFARGAAGRIVGFGYTPENLRLGNAIGAFTRPDRVIAAVRAPADRARVIELLRPFSERIEWMSVESAEMSKHALNAFLAMSIAFTNEIAALCEQTGADAAEVERALKTEARIGPRAYLAPGSAFAGGTLARDVVFLGQLGHARGVATHLLSAITSSNDAHRRWAQRRLEQLLDGVADKTVAVWGLTYKPDTDTLRRSSSVELCEWLSAHGATVQAHDPAVATLPPELAHRVRLAGSAAAALDGASALVVSTAWPAFRDVPVSELGARMTRRLVLDASRFTEDTLGRDADVEYVSVGRAPQSE